MTIYPVVIDAAPVFLEVGADPASALRMPLGTASVLEWLQAGIGLVTDEAWTVLTRGPAPDGGAALRAAGAFVERVEPVERFARVWTRFEPADQLLLLDVRRLPLEWRELRRLAGEVRRARTAGHLVWSSIGTDQTQELVHLDEAERVYRIQRYYAGVTWHRTEAVVASLVPVSALRQVGASAVADLVSLRQQLAAAGVVSRDIALEGGAVDLDEESGLLELNAQILRAGSNGRSGCGEVITGEGPHAPHPRVHPTARLHGPVVLQDDVEVAGGAVIVGPAVIGVGSRVGRDAVLVQCVTCPRTIVPEGTAFHHRILSGACTATGHDSARDGHGTPRLTAADRPRATVQQPAAPGRRAVYPHVKPVLEALVAALGLLVLWPLLVATAAAVKLTSRGPILFGHAREGRGGRPFRCWKFRTMVDDAHRQQRALYRQNEVDGPQFKLRHDPRITPLGRWLRHTNLDELPQLLNVLAGQMSLIGPRPSPFRENQICVPWRRARLSVRPGITGLWQICRHERAAGDFHQWIHYDMLYVRHLSFGLDLRILLATLLTFGGRWSVPLTWLIPGRRLRAAEGLVPRGPADRDEYVGPVAPAGTRGISA